MFKAIKEFIFGKPNEDGKHPLDGPTKKAIIEETKSTPVEPKQEEVITPSTWPFPTGEKPVKKSSNKPKAKPATGKKPNQTPVKNNKPTRKKK